MLREQWGIVGESYGLVIVEQLRCIADNIVQRARLYRLRINCSDRMKCWMVENSSKVHRAQCFQMIKRNFVDQVDAVNMWCNRLNEVELER